MEVRRYNTGYRQQWNRFVEVSRNGTFLLQRDYMDYHADRFTDYSLLFFTAKNELVAVLPANVSGKTLYSHQGLTYGGLILSPGLNMEQMLRIFDAMKTHLHENGFEKLVYKKIPAIYENYPSDEDLYALFRMGANLASRSIASVIRQNGYLSLNENRRRGVRKALAKGIEVRENADFSGFWKILEGNLRSKYQTEPVHSLDEIMLLKSRFPETIRCYEAFDGDEVIAGAVVYESEQVAHVQYISASEQGKKEGALDLLFYRLITETYAHKAWFDFGISTENNGTYLNEGLIRQKEGFGARGITYDCYQMEITK
ncbi:MAG: GNAT family N-acetyltransferase [Bacteroidales bacterium]